MQKHTKIYFDYFGYDVCDFILCEIPNCEAQAVDINHIDARGMGGNPKGDKDKIENLMATCRHHHIVYGDRKDKKEWLKEIHLQVMANHNSRA